MAKKSLYIYEQEKRSFIKNKKLLLLVVILLFTVVLVTLLTMSLKSREQATLERFEEALLKQDYASAMEIYYNVQGKATNQDLTEQIREQARDTQLKIEDLVGQLVEEYLVKINSGENLTAEEKAKIENLAFLSSMHINPYIKGKTEELLDAQISPTEWERILGNFSGLRNMETYIEELFSQKESLILKIEDFRKAGEREKEDNWFLTWSAWDDLRNDQEGSRFAREYASYRLLAYQEREYGNLMNLTSHMMKADRYYTAHKLLELMYEVFPEREELSERLKRCAKEIPEVIDSWTGDVLCLSLRPLVVREELAFFRNQESSYAYNSLLTDKEFQRLLEILYQEDYVLISPRQVQDWPKRRVEIKVPHGKKPLLLIFDDWQYNVLNQICGTVNRLYVEEDKLLAEAGVEQGEALDAIQILSDFLVDKPDFSFDGAKALITLSLGQSLFGYTLDEMQMQSSQRAWQRVGEIYPDLTEEEFQEQQAAASAVMNYLLEYGWDFASCGYHAYDISQLSTSDLEEELSLWQTFMSPWLKGLACFCFPQGGHVYGDDAKLETLLAYDYRIFFGQGPKPYKFATRFYQHFDSLRLNQYSLSDPSGYLQTNVLKGRDILSRDLRQED